VGERFTLADLSPVPSVLRVRQEGSAAAVELELVPGETRELDVRLSEELPVTGRVVDVEDKAIDAYVLVVGETMSERVAADGSFVLKLTSGAHTISAWTGSHKSRQLPIVVSGQPLDVGPITLEHFPPIGGVGIWWVDSGTSSPTIDHVAPGGPAALAGLLPGDIVVAVNGEAIEEVGDAAYLIRGPIGSTVMIKVRRTGAELAVQLVRVDLAALTAGSP
jgi:membrane-associated protease RseP (regulator of RpoE activity)